MEPVVVQVFGDKARKLEPEHHRMEFPGGAVYVDRTADGNYWVHVSIATEDDLVIGTHMGQTRGKVVGSRIDFDPAEYLRRVLAGLEPIPDIDGMDGAAHLAVCIKPEWPRRGVQGGRSNLLRTRKRPKKL